MMNGLKVALLAAAALIPAIGHAAEVRVCDGPLRSVPLNDERDVQSALLQAFAVMNTDAEPATLSEVELRLKAKGVLTDTRRLMSGDIDQAARSGPMVTAIEQQLPSQFCNGAMLKGAQMGKSATLAPGEALVFLWQPFAWQGDRDQMEIVASFGEAAKESSVTIPIDGVPARTPALFPLAGRSFVAVAASFHTPHRWVDMEEFALDIVVTGSGGGTYQGAGTRMTDYYAFGRPVRAVAGGTVLRVTSAAPDNVAMLKNASESNDSYLARLMAAQGALIVQGIEAVLGNHVIIDHGNGEFSVYAHLKHGSPQVKQGQMVMAGETIGALGSSGNSTEPHLHFQMCDNADLNRCRSVPVQFRSINLPFEYMPRTVQSGDLVDTLK